MCLFRRDFSESQLVYSSGAVESVEAVSVLRLAVDEEEEQKHARASGEPAAAGLEDTAAGSRPFYAADVFPKENTCGLLASLSAD